MGIRFSISERDGEMAPAPAEPRPGLLDSFFYNNQQNGMCEWGFTAVEVALKEQDNSFFFLQPNNDKNYILSQ